MASRSECRPGGEKQESRAGKPCIDLLVDDVDNASRRLTAQGVEFSRGSYDAVWGARTVNFMVPDGNLLQLTEIRWTEYLATVAPRS